MMTARAGIIILSYKTRITLQLTGAIRASLIHPGGCVMAENSFPASSSDRGRPNLHPRSGRASRVLFLLLLVAGLLFTGINLFNDVEETGAVVTTWTPFLLLGVALLIALGFEFVNGFHDTANAVATVIYTHSLPPHFAVVWSGCFNFLGVLLSSGAVAFGIIALLPVELILQVGSSAGFAMVFALLIAAILWNLGTWWLGLPASSSHTLIGSIIGVGVANALMHGRDGTSGVDWAQATKVGYSLLLSPLIGFVCAALLLLALRLLVKNRALYKAPKGKAPPPWWIRGLLILTCTGVSFAHGSNDGQKGMGLIMLILVGTLPMAYALNRTMPADQTVQFVAIAEVTQQVLVHAAATARRNAGSARGAVGIRAHQGSQAGTDPVAGGAARRHRRGTDSPVRRFGRKHAGAGGQQRAQRHVPDHRGDPPDGQGQRRPLRRRYHQQAGGVQAQDRRGDPLHPAVGEGRRGHRPRPGHHGRLEAHRGHGRREDRQDPPDLRPGRLGGAGGDDDHRRSGHVWVAGIDHPRAVFRRGRHHGGQRLRPADAPPSATC